MLYTIAVVMLVLWLLGLVTGTTMGGFVHILLVIAVVIDPRQPHLRAQANRMTAVLRLFQPFQGQVTTKKPSAEENKP